MADVEGESDADKSKDQSVSNSGVLIPATGITAIGTPLSLPSAASNQNRNTAHALSRRLLVPPLNFALVAPGVYRAGWPQKRNHEFLKKLALQTIIYLGVNPYSDVNQKFIDENGIRLVKIPIIGNKEPFSEIPTEQMTEALMELIDPRNQPVLVHCNKGLHRIGCLVGCLRKLQRWSMTAIFDEYRRYSGSSIKMLDFQFIELFDVSLAAKAMTHSSIVDVNSLKSES